VNVLVTGGAGFIGSHTVDALLARGDGVRILDALCPPVHPGSRPSYVPSEVELIVGDVRDKAAWEQALRGVDAVFHFAAYQDYMTDFSRFFAVNCTGTALLYEVAIERRLRLEKVVVASSQVVYGEGTYLCPSSDCPARGQEVHPDARPDERLRQARWDHECSHCRARLEFIPSREYAVSNPQSAYALSKHSQELLAHRLGRRYGVPTVALRYSIVQGSRQSFFNAYSGACRIFSLCYLFGRPPIVYEDGLQLRDFVNVHDVVAANLLALDRRDADGRTFNVGGPTASTVLDFADVVRRRFGSDVFPLVQGAYRYGDTRHAISENDALLELGWEPIRGSEETVDAYATWLEDSPEVSDEVDAAREQMERAQVLRTSAPQ
jgi:dTDP-L-rhamnose 4-epimerase